MTQKTLIQQGAEAKIILDKKNNIIIKDRIPKSYRLKELDETIRKRRTKAEKKLLTKAGKIINSPTPQESKDKTIIKMLFIDGKKLSEHLDDFSLTKQKQICEQIGNQVAKLHDENIIHGDLTTSNMIFVPSAFETPARSLSQIDNLDANNKNSQQTKTLTKSKSISERSEPIIFFIDFGLGFISRKYEDKAVDIHLLRQALESKHFKNWKTLYEQFLKGYKKSKDAKKTLNQLNKVEKRGRYKH